MGLLSFVVAIKTPNELAFLCHLGRKLLTQLRFNSFFIYLSLEVTSLFQFPVVESFLLSLSYPDEISVWCAPLGLSPVHQATHTLSPQDQLPSCLPRMPVPRSIKERKRETPLPAFKLAPKKWLLPFFQGHYLLRDRDAGNRSVQMEWTAAGGHYSIETISTQFVFLY